MDKVINIVNLQREDVENLKIGETIKIESNGKIVNGCWKDVANGLSNIFGNIIQTSWNFILIKPTFLHLNDKKYELFHGNTKWFSVTRLK